MFQPMRDVLECLEGAGVTPTTAELSFHRSSDEEATKVLRLFPELNWEANRSGEHQWVNAFVDGVEITLFVSDAKAVRHNAYHEEY